VSGPSAALGRLAEVVGEADLLTDREALGEYALDGKVPMAVAVPESEEEVGGLLRAASEAGLSVLVRGSGSHLYLGEPAGPMGVVVPLTRLNRVVEYEPGDLTMTVQAGMPLGALQRLTQERGQVVPLEPPGPGAATVGGIAATNLSGPRRMRYGSPRDAVIGMRVALTDGQVIKAGGKTVKNVAGYDVSKLFVGSLGTVGAMVEVTLRLLPAPEARAVMVAALESEEAAEAAARAVGSRLEVASCDIVNEACARRIRGALPVRVGGGRSALCVGLEGAREAIERQEREIRGMASGEWVRRDGEEAEDVLRAVRDLAYPAQEGATLLRASVPMTRTAEVLAEVSSRDGWQGVARVGDGQVYVSPDAEGPEIAAKLRELRGKAEGWGGYAVLESGSVELRREVGVWGEASENMDLMRGLKQSYDPAGVLGCGRFLRGL
jgi:glycolate oxidase FAD binding subunit